MPSSGLISPAKAGRYEASKSIGQSVPSSPTMIFSGFRSPWARSSVTRREGQPVEQPDEDLQALAVPEGGGLRHGFVQGGAFDPVAEDRIDPDAGFGRGVQVKLLFEKPLAVDLLQVAHRAQVTAQRADASAEADAEYGGGVAGAEAGAALFVAAHVDFTQRARQAAGVEKSQQVLTEGKHVAGIGFLASSDLSETAQVTKIR